MVRIGMPSGGPKGRPKGVVSYRGRKTAPIQPVMAEGSAVFESNSAVSEPNDETVSDSD